MSGLHLMMVRVCVKKSGGEKTATILSLGLTFARVMKQC